MAWVVDSCVLLDVALKDAQWGVKAAQCLDDRRAEGLLVCPVSAIEITPQFGGNHGEVRKFLALLGAGGGGGWQEADTTEAAGGWSRYVEARRLRKADKRPVADLLIGAFAARRGGLITRNPGHFRPWFPGLRMLEP